MARVSSPACADKQTKPDNKMKKLAILSLLPLTTAFTSRSLLQRTPPSSSLHAKKYVVIGGGWGGWGAAKALCENDDVEVTLIDALPDPTGVSSCSWYILYDGLT